MMNPASILLRETKKCHPKVYAKIFQLVKPYSIKTFQRVLQDHLEHGSIDLEIFNRRRDRIPFFLYKYARSIRKNFPSGGDSSGIELTCRLTRDDTQSILDSRHLKKSILDEDDEELVEPPLYQNPLKIKKRKENNASAEWFKSLRYELDLYSSTSQILEIACKRKFSSVYVEKLSVQNLVSIFRKEYCLLTRLLTRRRLQDNNNNNKGVCSSRGFVSPRLARFLILESKNHRAISGGKEMRLLYHQHPSRDLAYLLTHLPLHKFVAFNDMRQVFTKCGPTCYFLNAVRIFRMKHFGSNSKYFEDIVLALKFQISTGRLLPFNREGLARHNGRSYFEIVAFEALKRNSSIVATRLLPFTQFFTRKKSTDQMAVGISIVEGTGGPYAVTPDTCEQKKKKKKFTMNEDTKDPLDHENQHDTCQDTK